MPDRICFVYVWATSGGVERVFLNRSEALLRRDSKLELDIFFYQDYGGVGLFRRYLESRGLGGRVRIAPTFEPDRYDAVFTVDTPQIVTDYPSISDRVFMECHSAYPEGRAYLREWQTRLRTLIVPSPTFLPPLEAEFPALKGKIRVVRNFVPRLPCAGDELGLPAWRGPLFLYFGRVDEHKNLAEYVSGVVLARQYLDREPMGVVFGPISPGFPVDEVLHRHGDSTAFVFFPPVPFERSHLLLQMLRRRRTVFVSPSKGESFGLSVAEAMTAGLPVILSDIPSHSMLVSGREKFLYRLGDARQLARKMADAVEHYETFSAECLELAEGFSERAFLEDWDRLMVSGG
jgi:glycosyltransferase involved in cell wall biosynthesis